MSSVQKEPTSCDSTNASVGKPWDAGQSEKGTGAIRKTEGPRLSDSMNIRESVGGRTGAVHENRARRRRYTLIVFDTKKTWGGGCSGLR